MKNQYRTFSSKVTWGLPWGLCLERVCRNWVIFAKMSMPMIRLHGISLCFPAQTNLWQVKVFLAQTLAGEGFHQAHVVLEKP